MNQKREKIKMNQLTYEARANGRQTKTMSCVQKFASPFRVLGFVFISICYSMLVLDSLHESLHIL